MYRKKNTSKLALLLDNCFEEICEKKKTFTPRDIIAYLHNLLDIDILEQNDIHEFIMLFMDRLNKEVCSDLTGDLHSNMGKKTYNNSAFDKQRFRMDKEWCDVMGKEYSKIIEDFYGQSMTQIKCRDCGKIWQNKDIYQDISLAITPNATSIDDLLKEHFKTSNLSDWTCDNCHKGRSSSKITLLWRNPRILIIHLKRFQIIPCIQKNTKDIDIPHSLDLTEYTLGCTHEKYALKAVACHHGSYFGGHYRCICQNGSSWYIYDDDCVFKVEDPDFSNGYMLFYMSID